MTANERAKAKLDRYLEWARKKNPVHGEKEWRDECLADFKERNKEELEKLIKRAENHEILFCADGWTGSSGAPFIMTFDFEIAFDYAFAYGIRNGHPNLARIEYYEIGGDNHYGCPVELDYIGLKD